MQNYLFYLADDFVDAASDLCDLVAAGLRQFHRQIAGAQYAQRSVSTSSSSRCSAREKTTTNRPLMMVMLTIRPISALIVRRETCSASVRPALASSRRLVMNPSSAL